MFPKPPCWEKVSWISFRPSHPYPDDLSILLMERYPAPIWDEVGSLCYYLPGFSTIYQVVCGLREFWTINSSWCHLSMGISEQPSFFGGGGFGIGRVKSWLMKTWNENSAEPVLVIQNEQWPKNPWLVGLEVIYRWFIGVYRWFMGDFTYYPLLYFRDSFIGSHEIFESPLTGPQSFHGCFMVHNCRVTFSTKFPPLEIRQVRLVVPKGRPLELRPLKVFFF